MVNMMSIERNMTEDVAREWASRRWACEAITKALPHPTSFGDLIATITVRDRGGQEFRGYGYSGMAPWGVSMWSKAAQDLAQWEPQANLWRPGSHDVGDAEYDHECGYTCSKCGAPIAAAEGDDNGGLCATCAGALARVAI